MTTALWPWIVIAMVAIAAIYFVFVRGKLDSKKNDPPSTGGPS